MTPIRQGAALLLHDRGHILAIRRRGAHGAGQWGGPGGHVDPGETPRAALVREINEEIGIRLVSACLAPLAITRDHFDATRVYDTHWFAADLPAGAAPRNLEPDKIAALAWIAPDAIPEPRFLPVDNLTGRLADCGLTLADAAAGAFSPDPAPLAAALARSLAERGWSRASSADPAGWTPDNAAWGQCAVTSLLIAGLTGARILKTVARLPDGREIGHYVNALGGRLLDATAGQFPRGTQIPYDRAAPRREGHPSTRAYLLSSPSTRARYQRLLRDAPLAHLRGALEQTIEDPATSPPSPATPLATTPV